MPVITPKDFMDDLFGAFNTFWAARTIIAWPNKTFDPDTVGVAQEAAYVRPQIAEVPGNQAVYSSSSSPQTLSRTGTFGVEIFTRGEGALDQALELRDGVLQFVERPPKSIAGAIFSQRGTLPIGFNGVWYQENVSATFLYFTDRAP